MIFKNIWPFILEKKKTEEEELEIFVKFLSNLFSGGGYGRFQGRWHSKLIFIY